MLPKLDEFIVMVGLDEGVNDLHIDIIEKKKKMDVRKDREVTSIVE